MEQPCYTYRNGDFIGGLFYDSYPCDPRKTFDNLGHMVCWHGHYELGDETPKVSIDEYLTELACSVQPNLRARLNFWDDEGYTRVYSMLERAQATARDMIHNMTNTLVSRKQVQLINAALQKVLMLNLYLYDHSGITMNTTGFSCSWDSGQVGFIYVLPDEIVREFGADTPEIRAQVREILIGEVETYDAYLTGDVYGYCAGRMPEGATEDDFDFLQLEDEDSCWGFYGFDYAQEELESVVDNMAKN